MCNEMTLSNLSNLARSKTKKGKHTIFESAFFRNVWENIWLNVERNKKNYEKHTFFPYELLRNIQNTDEEILYFIFSK